ncbi:tetratricopeptide repeat protein [Litoribrevibacter euphylliae]|uniref:Tetratricopeptide repeat protein n=1 Tax=Litoribrevibacter euphylliae TaxID=1834034 RepID=A0ABV7HBR4_9GAMM
MLDKQVQGASNVISMYEQHRRSGDLEKARALLIDTWKSGLNDPELLYKLGESFFLDKQPENAIKFLKLAEKYQPRDPRYCHLIGQCYVELNALDDAKMSFMKPSEQDRLYLSDIELAQLHAISSYEEFGVFDYERAFQKQPTLDVLEGYVIHLITTLKARSVVDLEFLEKVSSLLNIWHENAAKPEFVLKWFALFYQRVGNYALAQDYYQSYLRYFPDDISVLYNLSQVELSLGSYHECYEFYKNREKIQGSIGSNKAVLISRGMRELRYDELDQVRGKKLIIVPDQGMGDQIWSLSFISDFTDKFGCSIEIWMAPKISEAVKQFYIDSRIIIKSFDEITDSDGNDALAFVSLGDVFFLLSELAFNVKAQGAYMKVGVSKFNESLGSGIKKVGLSWKSIGSPLGKTKDIPLEFLVELKAYAEYSFIACQYGDVKIEINSLRRQGLALIEETNIDLLESLVETYRIVAGCSKVITCSNTTAHIAGSLGIETLLLTNSPTIWYWNKPGPSQWYQSVTVVQKELHESWDVLWSKVCNFLSES